MREFLAYVSKYPVEDLQAFSKQWVPSPHWVKTETVTVPDKYLSSAAATINDQLGPKGVARVGGKEWWQWRGPAEDLKGEWIEMRYHYNERKKAPDSDKTNQNRIMLYIHGGAYFFGSVDTHRYQMQRHARKLKARVFAREFNRSYLDENLQDCLAAYLFLLSAHNSKEIILAGDSAGAGLVLSIMGENSGDYIPQHGFRHKPSQAWPPPNSEEILAIKKETLGKKATQTDLGKATPHGTQAQDTAVKGYNTQQDVPSTGPVYPGQQNGSDFTDEALLQNISVPIDGKDFEIKDQINMYTTNQLLSHPLVSPVLQPSLGGLPPLLVQSGGGEILRDEQFYLAHKAANPKAYQPSAVYLDEYDPNREALNKYPPTYVQLQVWDDLCHVAPSLSFSRPAKYMYRAIAQFGAWALAHAQDSEIDIPDTDMSPISSSESDSSDTPPGKTQPKRTDTAITIVGKAGDPLPPFEDHMMRQRVDKRGNIYPLKSPSSYPVLQLPKERVGAINPELVKKWLAAKTEWDVKFSKEKLRTQQQRIKELAHGFQEFNGGSPPPSSLAARRSAPGVLPARHARKSYPMMIWSGWGSKHDRRALERERLAEKEGRSRRTSVDAGRAGASIDEQEGNKRAHSLPEKTSGDAVPDDDQSRSGSRRKVLIDVAKANQGIDGNQSSTGGLTNGEASKQPISKLSTDQPLSPMLVLPDYDNKQSFEENASTRALFHASGTIPMTSSTSLPRSRYHAPSRTGSWTGITTDAGEDAASTVGGDEKSLAVTNTGIDAASTRAVLGASGVVGLMGDGENSRVSHDTSSVNRLNDTDAQSSVGDGITNGVDHGKESPRPTMPDRDFFKTAEEYH
ncbi:hypothetical protein MW887_006158 [Aspergillus wentii]|nr:hypothetical protein MW887_006158 [Aspergillus wentii]